MSWSPYSGENRTADVLPLVGVPEIDRFSLEVTWTDAAVLRDVPVAVVGTDRSTDHIPLEEGDTGLILTMGHSLDEILDTDRRASVAPEDPRFGDLMDSYFLPISWTPGSSSSAEADRHISGGDVRLGNAATARSVAHNADLNALRAVVQTIATALSITLPPDSASPYSGTTDVKGS